MNGPMPFEVNLILRAADARLPLGSPSTEFRGAFVDSRAVVEGALFVGIRGENTDGGQHAYDALRAGAAAAIVTESAWRWIEGDVLSMKKPVIVTKDPVAALQAAGRIALERSGARVVGITGAVGKTTTKDILVAMLAAAGVAVHGSAGNRNTEIGVPLTLLDMPEGTEVLVLEMGMRGPGQIAELAALAPPHIGCVTAIGPVHLELLGTVEAVASAKAELLRALGPGGTAIIPSGEPLIDAELATLDPGVSVVRFGDTPSRPLRLNLDAGWMLRNAAAAYACCEALGRVPAEDAEIDVQLSALRGAQTRLAGGGLLIEDCYNANPLAMHSALADLVARPAKRRVAVFADMKELGADERAFHEEIGHMAAELGVDLLVAVGELGASYAVGAAGRIATMTYSSVEACASDLAGNLQPGDVILLKGSRSMALERVGAVLKAELPAS